MAITQKKVKERIKTAEDMIEKTVTEKDKVLDEIKKYREESNNIDLLNDENITEKADELNGLMKTITHYNGELLALEWVLSEMRAKNKKKGD